MQEFNLPPTAINELALDTAIRAALADQMIGLSTYGPDRHVSFWLDNTATIADTDQITAIYATHNPVFISADKLRIVADGIDRAVITIRAQTPVNLLVSGVSVPVTLINGVGTLEITSIDRVIITITVENPGNRCADVITIEAI